MLMDSMSAIYFENDFICVVPAFMEVELHKHYFLHIFFLEDDVNNICEKLLIINGNVIHDIHLCKKSKLFLLIDPTSILAKDLKNHYLLNRDSVIYELGTLKRKVPNLKDKQETLQFVNEMLKNLNLHRKYEQSNLENKNRDERIVKLINDIQQYRYLESSISEIAKSNYISEGRLSHMFKECTGISLKGYLNIKQLEKAYKLILQGESIVNAALESGFSSASHLASTCKKQTGISISKVLK